MIPVTISIKRGSVAPAHSQHGTLYTVMVPLQRFHTTVVLWDVEELLSMGDPKRVLGTMCPLLALDPHVRRRPKFRHEHARIVRSLIGLLQVAICMSICLARLSALLAAHGATLPATECRQMRAIMCSAVMTVGSMPPGCCKNCILHNGPV